MIINKLKLLKLHGAEIAEYIPALARLRISIFRDYPYLYEGDLDYEQHYLQTYLKCPASTVIIVLDGEQVVGASTAIPLQYEMPEIQAPFLEQGLNVKSFFYLGESVLLPAYRGQGIYRHFFNYREAAAKNQGCDKTLFMAVVRPDHHRLKPANYQSLELIWRHFGYQPQPTLMAYLSWKEITETQLSPKPMLSWVKQL